MKVLELVFLLGVSLTLCSGQTADSGSGDCVTACAGLTYNEGCNVDVHCYTGEGNGANEPTDKDTCIAGCLEMDAASVTQCNVDIVCPKMCPEGFTYVEETDECAWSLSLSEGDDLTVTCDMVTVDVYADGQSIVTGDLSRYYYNPDTVTIPRGSSVVAIKCSKRGRGRAGMIAASTGGILTGPEWKCAGRYYQGWTEPDFDDSDTRRWKPAKDLGEQNEDTATWGTKEIAGIQNTGAHWIWYDGFATTAYCRYKKP